MEWDCFTSFAMTMVFIDIDSRLRGNDKVGCGWSETCLLAGRLPREYARDDNGIN